MYLHLLKYSIFPLINIIYFNNILEQICINFKQFIFLIVIKNSNYQFNGHSKWECPAIFKLDRRFHAKLKSLDEK